MRELSGADTQMVYTGGRHVMNMFAPMGIWDPATIPDGRIDLERVLEYVDARLHISPTFRERLVRMPLGLDRARWIRDASFDLRYHVREIALPPPGSWEQFTTQVARLGERPLDLDRPPWELYVIHGLDGVPGLPPGAFATMFKVHHAAVDGVASAVLVASLLQLSPTDPPPPPPAEEWVPEEPPGLLGSLVGSAVRMGLRPLRDPAEVWRFVRAVPEVAKEVFLSPSTGVPMLPSRATRFNADLSPHRSWDMTSFPIEEVKRIRAAVPGATVNDVALAITGGGLRGFLEAEGELPDFPLTAAMPVSRRPTMTQGGEAAAEGNEFTVTFVPLGSEVEDPLQRLARIHAATTGAKEHGNAQGMTEFLMSAQLLPGALVAQGQRAILRAFNAAGRAIGAHCVVTNVPAPPLPLYFCGARAVQLTGVGPVVDGMGLAITVSSYLTELSLTWTADRAMLPEPAALGEAMRESYAALRAAVG